MVRNSISGSHQHLSAMQLNESLRQWQPQSGALTLRFVLPYLAELLEDSAWSSGAIPIPLSRTAISTAPSLGWAETSTRPSSGVNLTALDSKLKITCFTLRSSASMMPSSGAPPSRA